MKIISAFFIVNIFCFTANCQVKELTLKDLQTPNAPGFVLADKSPSAVEKPTNPRAFGISLLNLREGGAIEFTPFWLFRQPKYTQAKYAKRVPILPTLSLSAATYKTDTSSAISIGFRTHLLRFFSIDIKEELNRIGDTAALISALSTLDSTELATLPDDTAIFKLVGGGVSFKKLSASGREKAVEKAIDELKARINDRRNKPSFQVELAGAYLGESRLSSFKDISASKMGAWLNIHYRPTKFPIDFLGLVRYSKTIGGDVKSNKDSSFIDFGFGLAYEKNKFDLHLEYVNRQDVAYKQNYNRLVFVANYQIFDEITLVASFGKNFKEVNNLFTVLGTKIGISRARVKL